MSLLTFLTKSAALLDIVSKAQEVVEQSMELDRTTTINQKWMPTATYTNCVAATITKFSMTKSVCSLEGAMY